MDFFKIHLKKAHNIDDDSAGASSDDPPARKRAKISTTPQPLKKEKELMKLCSQKFLGASALNQFSDLVSDDQVDINYVDAKGLSPLLALCLQHKKASLLHCIVLMLKRQDLNINWRHGANVGGSTGCFNALAMVCRYYPETNLFEIVQLLLDRGAQPDVTDRNGNNALIAICANYKHEDLMEIVQLLLKTKKIDLNVTNSSEKWTALFALCYNYKGDNLLDVIKLLVENGADVNIKDKLGWNCLLAAAVEQRHHRDLVEIIRFFISNGTDVNAVDCRESFTALQYICSDNYEGDRLIELVDLLLDAGADMHIASSIKKRNWKPIHFLCWNNLQTPNFFAICLRFIAKGFDINSQDGQGRTLLHILYKGEMSQFQVQNVRNLLLIPGGINVHLVDNCGLKAVDYLRRQKTKKILKINKKELIQLISGN